jgi:hypothetical protein
LALNPRRDMPIFRGKERAAGAGWLGLCPVVVRTVGHVRWRWWAVRVACPFLAGRSGHFGTRPGGRADRGACPCGGSGQCGACPFLAGRSGLFWAMSSPRAGRGVCPAEEPRAGAGRPNWAKLESSGILVSAFDSEATGEFA